MQEDSTMRLSAVGLLVTLALAILAAPLAADAQQTAKVPTLDVHFVNPVPVCFGRDKG